MHAAAAMGVSLIDTDLILGRRTGRTVVTASMEASSPEDQRRKGGLLLSSESQGCNHRLGESRLPMSMRVVSGWKAAASLALTLINALLLRLHVDGGLVRLWKVVDSRGAGIL
jgi:hypothetical protein